MNEPVASDTGRHFIRQIIEQDIAEGLPPSQVVTRFPPEPNGYIHIGHAKAICVDFGMANEFGGKCNLRMDDTNPSKESDEYAENIQRDIRWLGFQWSGPVRFGSNYFDKMHEIAVELIKRGQAYVCDLSQEEWKKYRGIPTEPGTPSPYRDRSVEENLDLFARMGAGEFPDGSRCLRAKIDMASPNIHFRDPVIYRILTATHYHLGDKWRVYPMYDFAHPIEDAIEGVTHSLCTLEFEVHRPLYDWVIDRMDEMGMLVVRDGIKIRPKQREFARLNLDYTVMSKRKLLQLVKEGLVKGWDDPRMPTICGMRRRGYPAAAIREFCNRIGVSKFESATEIALLEHCVRDELNRVAPRRMAVLDPVKVVIDNYPEGQEETFEAVNNPEDPSAGTRKVPFSRELFIEAADFMENPPKKFFRLAPGQEVRLRYACLARCVSVDKNADGSIAAIHCTYDPDSRGGNAPDGRRVKGTIHWVSAKHAVKLPVRLYDRLFSVPEPDGDDARDFREFLNPDSCSETACLAEPALAETAPGEVVQFERMGYFCADEVDSKPGAPVFNRTATLKDSWSKAAQ